MNRRRLEHTARSVLPFVEPEQFDMIAWQCGSAACAFGHEALSTFGRDQGLTLAPIKDGRIFPYFNGKDGFAAAADYYDIDLYAVYWIFSLADYNYRVDAPAEAASRIESLLASESP